MKQGHWIAILAALLACTAAWILWAREPDEVPATIAPPPDTGPALMAAAPAANVPAATARLASRIVTTNVDWPDLLPVPGGKVSLGSSAAELLEVANGYYPMRPRSQKKLLRNLVSELGDADVTVAPFLLHREVVTNEQYLCFVEATGHRFPFHWWKYGRHDDWGERMPEARERFRGHKGSDLLYWESEWQSLPFAIPKGTERHPVTFVSWHDAQAFAEWSGSRLPTEAEWVLAARGETDHEFVWGDRWTDEMLDQLELRTARQRTLKEVRHLGQIARGPFGHDAMAGNVWMWTSGIGCDRAAGEASYQRELAELEKSGVFAGVQVPDWTDLDRVVKGGSYLSADDPAQLRVQTRGKANADETLEAIGFRIAKSPMPARDLCGVRIRRAYRVPDDTDLEPNLADQVGVERYVLSEDRRLLRGYQAVGLVPSKQLQRGSALPDKADLRARARVSPMPVAVLLTTEALAQPELDPGMYTVYLREIGLPHDLRAALDADTSPNERNPVLARYGITEAEAAAHPDTPVDFVRVDPGGYRVPTDTAALVFRANDGDVVAHVALDRTIALGDLEPAGTEAGTDRITFTWGVPVSDLYAGIGLQMNFSLRLAAPPQGAWRTPD